MFSPRFIWVVAPALYALVGIRTADAKTVVVPFSDQRIQYDGAWSLSREQGSPGPLGICVDSFSQTANASSLGAAFSFSFNGTEVRVVTSSGPGVAAYNITRDYTTVASVQPALYRADTCMVTFASAPFTMGAHTIRVALTDSNPDTQLRVLGILYDDGSSGPIASAPSSTKRLSTGATLAILICVIIGILAVLAPIVWLYCIKNRVRRRHTRQPRRLEMKEKVLGVLSSTPSFLKHSRTKYFRTHIRLESDELPKSTPPSTETKSSKSSLVLSLLRPVASTRFDQTSSPRPPQPAAVRYGHLQRPSVYYVHHTDRAATDYGV